jgi:hypothetical protein
MLALRLPQHAGQQLLQQRRFEGLVADADTPASCTAARRLSLDSLVTIRMGTSCCQLRVRTYSTNSRPSISGML